jgi:hypothetical protein
MAGPVVEVRRHFDSSPRALRDARKFLAETIGDRVGDEENEALALALSELTTNAVVHARTDFDVVIGIDGQVASRSKTARPTCPVVAKPTRWRAVDAASTSCSSSATAGASTSCGTASACGASETFPTNEPPDESDLADRHQPRPNCHRLTLHSGGYAS